MSVRNIKEKYEKTLLGVEGITGVGFNSSIIVYVKELTPQLKGFLPKALDGVPVKVIVTGEITLLSMGVPMMRAIYAERTRRYRPVIGGVSCGHPEVTAGTFTCSAIDKKTPRIVGLSNNHVIALDWGNAHIGKKGDSILQPAPHDDGIDDIDKIGELERWIPVKLDEDNFIDAAIFRSDMLGRDIQGIGCPNTVKDPKVGMKLLKSGRTSAITYTTVIDVDATIIISGGDWGSCLFRDQIVTSPAFIYPGDSGSWVGEIDTYRSVGLGSAGSPLISVLGKISNVEKLLDIAVLPPIRTMSMLSMAIPLGIVSLIGGVLYGGRE